MSIPNPNDEYLDVSDASFEIPCENSEEQKNLPIFE